MIHRILKVNQALRRNQVFLVLRPERNFSCGSSQREVGDGLLAKASCQNNSEKAILRVRERIAGVGTM